MRKLSYVVNGIEVNTLAEAKALESKYRTKYAVKLERIEESAPALSPLRKEMCEKYNRVVPGLYAK